MTKVLILGGTRDARIMAAELLQGGHAVTTSLAGVTQAPVLPDGDVRVGGFGGAEGLAAYLKAEAFDVLIDATHPFAEVISRSAGAAALVTGVRHFRLARPAWIRQTGDHWIEVNGVAAAVEALPHGAKVLLTIGRKEVAPFFERRDLSGVIRSIEPPAAATPDGWRLMQERPPFSLESELALLQQGGFSHLVTKNAGGSETEAKLVAARQAGLPVVMIRRPVKSGGEVVGSITQLSEKLGVKKGA
jgi:precorrin-6A/cobalt-precorrin-6A reductase